MLLKQTDRQRTLMYMLVLLVLVFLAGCGSGKTETGYDPKPIGIGSKEIRAVYAPAFSPEAKMTEENKKPDFGGNFRSK